MKLRAKFEPKVMATTPKAKPPIDKTVSSASKNLALAHKIDRLIEQGLIADYSAAARMLGVSQPRLTHLMSLRLLAPVIQEAILAGTVSPPDKKLRRLARVAEWPAQVEAFTRA